MTPTNRLESIEARLAKATPGPWFKTANWYVSSDEKYSIYSRQTNGWAGNDDPIICQVQGPGHRRGEDFDLIAHAPSDLAWAVARIRELTELVAKKDEALRFVEAYGIVELEEVVFNALALRVDAGEMK